MNHQTTALRFVGATFDLWADEFVDDGCVDYLDEDCEVVGFGSFPEIMPMPQGTVHVAVSIGDFNTVLRVLLRLGLIPND